MKRKNKGYVSLNTGNGKGKTTAAVGQAVRALGRGFSVYIGQFLKSEKSGEVLALEMTNLPVTVELYGRERTIGAPMTDQDRLCAVEGLKKITAALDRYDMVVADEIIVALSTELLSFSDLENLIQAKRDGTELILTGRGATEELIAMADVVTEMVEVKHHYRSGVPARDGIER